MQKILIIARREYQALVRTKAFIVSLVMVPVFMLGGIFVQTYLSKRIDVSEKKVVVLDGTGRLFAPLEALARQHNGNESGNGESGKKTRADIVLEPGTPGPVTDETRLALSDRIRHNEIFAFVEIDADALQPTKNSALVKMLRAAKKGKATEAAIPGDAAAVQGNAAQHNSVPGEDGAENKSPVRMYSESIAHDEVGRWVMQSIQQVAFALRLQDSGLDPAAVAGVVGPIGMEELGLYSRASNSEIHKGDEGTRTLGFFIPFGLVMLMFMSVMIVGQPMLNCVLEEKQQRIAEVLLGSASPFQLMMGKLVGNVCVALTMVGLYMAGGYLVAAHYGYADLLPMWLLGWFVAFEILACVFYGALFISVGAVCSDLKDAQSLLMPVMLMAVFPLMVWFTVLQEPLSSFATWVSLFPPATPMLMLLRMAASPMVPLWQTGLGMVLVLAATVVCVFAAGRVFRIGLLMQGKAPKLNELARWIVQG